MKLSDILSDSSRWTKNTMFREFTTFEDVRKVIEHAGV